MNTEIIRLFSLKSIAIGWFALTGMNVQAQQLYDDFEGNTVVNYDTKGAGHIKLVKNPSQDAVNSSANCAMYSRSTREYDNIKISFQGKMEGLDKYVTYNSNPAKLKMKVYTKAPAGQLIEIQLGRKSGNPYPENIYAQFRATTTVSGAWEELTFDFVETPAGCKITADDVNQITILFSPTTGSKEKFYFDDLRGPGFTSKGESASKAGTR